MASAGLDNDPQIAWALAVIQEQYGDIVSVDAKKKSLLKFGRNSAIGTSSAYIS